MEFAARTRRVEKKEKVIDKITGLRNHMPDMGPLSALPLLHNLH